MAGWRGMGLRRSENLLILERGAKIPAGQTVRDKEWFYNYSVLYYNYTTQLNKFSTQKFKLISFKKIDKGKKNKDIKTEWILLPSVLLNSVLY